MKQVVLDQPKTTVSVSNINSDKIYASVHRGQVYKLQRVAPHWMFCEHGASEGGSCGSCNTAQEAITRDLELTPVYEFDSAEEFLAWALDIVRKGKE